jgi:Ca2+-binding RTX toxin-like protein
MPLLGGAPAMAITTGFYTGNGSDVVDLTYGLTMTMASPFCFDFYRSADMIPGNADPNELWLSQYCITDPAMLVAGTHSLMLTLGTDMDLVTDATEIDDDYYLIAASGVHAYLFEGVYQYPDVDAFTQQSVFVHGTGGDDMVVVNPDGSVVLNGANSGPHADIGDFRIRTHGGADSVDLINLNWGANALARLGPGDDWVKPGWYQNWLYGDNGTDTLDMRHATNQVLLDMPNNFASWGYGNLVSFWGFENAYGGAYDDYLYGDDGNNWLDGQGGDDDINGGGGHDTLRGGAGYDYIWGGAGNDTCNVGADGGHAYGDAGFDTLVGSDVNDILVGGADGDRFWPGLGYDTIIGEGGRDTVDYFHPTAVGGVQVDLSNLMAMDQGGAYDYIAGVEDVLGSAYDDVIVGDRSMNFLYGRDGDDELNGKSGHDVLWGGLGADYLDGEARDDTLYGNDDTCTDDGAVDTLRGNQGFDTGYGVPGFDIFLGIEVQMPCP